MSGNRTKKSAINAVIALVYQIVIIACGLITPRIILENFGSTYNGIVSSATQILNLISLLSLGLAGSIRVALYPALAANDRNKISGIMNAAKKMYRRIGYIMLLFICVMMFVYPLISHNSVSFVENALLVFIVGIGSFANYFFGIANSTLLISDQKGYVPNIVSSIATIANTFVIYLIVRLGGNVFLAKLGSATVFFFSPIILNAYCNKKYALDNSIPPDDSALAGRHAVAMHSIANIVHENTDIVLLTMFTDAKVISVYTVYYMVVGKIKTLSNTLTNNIEAALGNIIVKGEKRTLEAAFSAFEFLSYLFVIIVFTCIFVLLLPFIELYTQNVSDIEYLIPSFAVLVTVAEACYCLRQPYLVVVQAAGAYEETKWWALIEACVNIGLSLVLVFLIGLNGVVIGTIVANIIRTTQFAIYASKNILKRSMWVFIKRLIWCISCCAVIVVLQLFVLCKVDIAGWWGWIIKGGLAFIIATILAIVFSIIVYRHDLCYVINKFLPKKIRKIAKIIDSK